MARKEVVILAGPNTEDLAKSLTCKKEKVPFGVDMVLGTSVHFTYEKAGFSAHITSMEQDGSLGESWNLKGYPVTSKHECPYSFKEFTGYYNPKTRRGHFTLEMKG